MKNEILKTAGELFFKYGVRSVSVDDICNEMHISKKTFYVHFKQKDELIECLLNSMRDEDIKKQAEFLNTDNVIIASIVNYKNLVKSFNVDKHIAFVYDLEKYYPKIMNKHREEKKLNLINSIKSMIMLGIKQGFFQLQMNVLSYTQLVEAKKHPERYPGLIVRVWGFSAYFNDLPDSYKKLLIKRALVNEGKKVT